MTTVGKFKKWRFTPTDVSDCSIWLDASDSSKVTTSGSNITQLTDKSGNGNNATQDGTQTYPITGSTINNLSTANFSAVTSQMNLTATLNAQAKSCFVVFRHTVDIFSQSGKFQNFLGLNSPGRLNFLLDGNTTSPNRYTITLGPNTFSGNTLSATALSSSYNFQNPTMIAAVQDTTAANNIITANGSTLTTSSNGAAGSYNLGSNTMELGRGTSTTFYRTTWLLGEYIQYNKYVAPSERQKIEGYLAWKWGLVSNLPAGHPYKTFPPST